MRVFILARHGESQLNVERRVNGDPSVPVPLSDRGQEEARRLGEQVEHFPLDACVHTRFPRTRETAVTALSEREDVPLVEEPRFDDIDIGDLEGQRIEDYREWKHGTRAERPLPGRREPRRRGAALRRGLPRAARLALALGARRHARDPDSLRANAAAGSDSLDGPAHEISNAVPYLFDEEALERAVGGSSGSSALRSPRRDRGAAS